MFAIATAGAKPVAAAITIPAVTIPPATKAFFRLLIAKLLPCLNRSLHHCAGLQDLLTGGDRDVAARRGRERNTRQLHGLRPRRGLRRQQRAPPAKQPENQKSHAGNVSRAGPADQISNAVS